MIRCECGRPALVLPKMRKRSSRTARAGRPYAIKHHPQCQECYRKELDRRHAARLVEDEGGAEERPG